MAIVVIDRSGRRVGCSANEWSIAIGDRRFDRANAFKLRDWLADQLKGEQHPDPAPPAQDREPADLHATDKDGRPLGCDVCRHAVSRFNGGNGATTCTKLADRIVAIGVNRPNYRPLGCPFNRHDEQSAIQNETAPLSCAEKVGGE